MRRVQTNSIFQRRSLEHELVKVQRLSYMAKILKLSCADLTGIRISDLFVNILNIYIKKKIYIYTE